MLWIKDIPYIVVCIACIFIGAISTLLIVVVYSMIAIKRLEGPKMKKYYRNFYLSSEDDIRELEVVRAYVFKNNLIMHEHDLKYSPIIAVTVLFTGNEHVEYFEKFGFSKVIEVNDEV